jgi:hypothetical protein
VAGDDGASITTTRAAVIRRIVATTRAEATGRRYRRLIPTPQTKEKRL